MNRIIVWNKDGEVVEVIDNVLSVSVDASVITEGALILVYRCEGDTDFNYIKLKGGKHISIR